MRNMNEENSLIPAESLFDLLNLKRAEEFLTEQYYRQQAEQYLQNSNIDLFQIFSN